MIGRGEKIQVWGYDFIEFLLARGKHIQTLENLDFNLIKEELSLYLEWWSYPQVVHSKTTTEKTKVLKNIIQSRVQKDLAYFLIYLIKFSPNNLYMKIYETFTKCRFGI